MDRKLKFTYIFKSNQDSEIYIQICKQIAILLIFSNDLFSQLIL